MTFLFSLLMCFTLAFAVYGKINEQNSELKNMRTVILDAGHGGEDGGAVGAGGVIEKDINLAITLKLKDLLEVSGYKVILTRDKDTAIYDEEAESLRQKKRSDLRNRAKIIKNNSDNENTIFVSIHQNKFPDPSYFGTQIFYSKNDPQSKDLANYIKESVVKLIQPENTREIKEANKKIFLLHNAEIPAVVAECGFLSNKDEAEKLAEKDYQSQVAFSIYCGITSFFLNNK